MSKLRESRVGTATKNGRGQATNRVAELDDRDIGPVGQSRREVVIRPPNFKTAVFTIIGTAPLMTNKFSEKAKAKMRATQEGGSTSRKGGKREARDFEADCKGATYIAKDGWKGFPSTAIRAAMVSACRTVGYKMTHAKLAVFPQPDGYDAHDSTPIIKITKGEPSMHVGPGRNDNGSCDLRARPLWESGWEAQVRIKFDADMFSLDDVANLLSRVGEQVGLCEGRPDSRHCVGLGFGTFRIEGKDNG